MFETACKKNVTALAITHAIEFFLAKESNHQFLMKAI
jgi:hypothetical protein